jgi:hypothetical protein
MIHRLAPLDPAQLPHQPTRFQRRFPLERAQRAEAAHALLCDRPTPDPDRDRSLGHALPTTAARKGPTTGGGVGPPFISSEGPVATGRRRLRITFGGWRRGARHERSSALFGQTTPPPPTLHHSLRAVYSGARRRRAEAPTTLLSDGAALRSSLPRVMFRLSLSSVPWRPSP